MNSSKDLSPAQQHARSSLGRGAWIAILGGGGIFMGALVGVPQLRKVLQKAPSVELSSAAASSVTIKDPTFEQFSQSSIEPQRAAEPKEFLTPPATSTRFSEKIRWVQTIRVLPTQDLELESAHRLARRNACEPLPAGEPTLSQSFQPYLTRRDYREYAEKVPALSKRQAIFSAGLDMLPADQRNLPSFSGRRILAYLRSHYITLQVRVQKEPLSGALFLHHRSLAGVAQYQNSGLTQQPTEGLGKTLQNYRSLGLFLPNELEPTPENLRTLVLVHKSDRAADANLKLSATKYEYVFVRAHPSGSRREPKLTLHTFATSDRRQTLHYLKPGGQPQHNDLCSFKTLLYFTDYSHAGLYPTDSASRGTVFNDQAEFSLEQLEKYATLQQWTGGALQNVTQLLDAIIEKKISS